MIFDDLFQTPLFSICQSGIGCRPLAPSGVYQLDHDSDNQEKSVEVPSSPRALRKGKIREKKKKNKRKKKRKREKRKTCDAITKSPRNRPTTQHESSSIRSSCKPFTRPRTARGNLCCERPSGPGGGPPGQPVRNPRSPEHQIRTPPPSLPVAPVHSNRRAVRTHLERRCPGES